MFFQLLTTKILQGRLSWVQNIPYILSCNGVHNTLSADKWTPPLLKHICNWYYSTTKARLRGFSKTDMCGKILNFRCLKAACFNVWVRYFVPNFKGTLWNSTQNILPIGWKMCILLGIQNLRVPRFTSFQAFLNAPYIIQVLSWEFRCSWN